MTDRFAPDPSKFAEVTWPARRVSLTFSHDTCGDDMFCTMCAVAVQEYIANDPAGQASTFLASNGVRIEVTSHELQQWKSAPAPVQCVACRDDPERRADIEVAHAQAVEFAQYVVDHAKGKMVERAEHFLSFKYSQEIAKRLAVQVPK